MDVVDSSRALNQENILVFKSPSPQIDSFVTSKVLKRQISLLTFLAFLYFSL